MVLEYYGVMVDQDSLFRLASQEQRRGTSAQGLAQAASRYGRPGTARAAVTFEELVKLLSEGVPVIAFVKAEVLYSARVSLRKAFQWLWQRVKWEPELLHAVVVIG